MHAVGGIEAVVEGYDERGEHQHQGAEAVDSKVVFGMAQ